MHQQSHFTRPGAATASLGWEQQDTSRFPCLRWTSQAQCWCESCGVINPSRGQGQQELLRLRTAGQPRERVLCSPDLGQCSLRNQGHLLLTHFSWGSPHHRGCVWSHQPYRALGTRSVETRRLVSPISQLAEWLQFLFQPTGTDNVELLLSPIYRREMVVQSFRTLPRNLTASTTDLNLMSWHPPKWEHPRSSVLGLLLVVEGDSFYTVMMEDGQAATEQV